MVRVGMTSSSEDSSSPVVEEAEELDLGLGLGPHSSTWRPSSSYARILTAQDLPSLLLSSSAAAAATASSSSSSCSTLSRAHASAGTKRPADSVSPPNAAPSQVVGWPPIRAYRMNSMGNQAKSVATEAYKSMIEKGKIKSSVEEITKANYGNSDNCKGRASPLVKVYMDGMPIGRKVDLCSQGCYNALEKTLEDMFFRHNPTIDAKRPYTLEMMNLRRQSKLLDGSSEFVLAYEDKEGDWMLVGDVPWGMFLTSAKRLKIMRRSEATGLGKLM